MYLFCAALDVVWGEEGQLFEVRVLGPHGLGDHLSQFHSSQCRTEPAVTGQDVDTGLDQTNSLHTHTSMGQMSSSNGKACSSSNQHLAQDLLSVRLQLSTQLHSGEVSLQQQVGLHVGIVELGVVQFVGHLLCQLNIYMKKTHTHVNDCFGNWVQFVKMVSWRSELFLSTWRRSVSSWCLMGMFLYSAALEMISIKPRILVLAFRDMLNNSEKQMHNCVKINDITGLWPVEYYQLLLQMLLAKLLNLPVLKTILTKQLFTFSLKCLAGWHLKWLNSCIGTNQWWCSWCSSRQQSCPSSVEQHPSHPLCWCTWTVPGHAT